jgi:hypothetical protein
MNLLFLFGIPHSFTPVSICASGKRLIMEAVVIIADSPGRLYTSHIRSNGGSSPNGALATENAFSIPCAILLIQLIFLSFLFINIGNI